ncbi:metallophosphoesterase [Sphingomonas piscis]
MLEAIERDCLARPTQGRKVRLVFLGDFIDRGPSSKLLILALREASRSEFATVLLGNHEQAMLSCASGMDEARDSWLMYGGAATLASFGIREPAEYESTEEFAGRLSEGLGEGILNWLRDLPLYWRSGDFFFCHAGVRPGRALHRQRPRDLLWIRSEFLESSRYHGAIIVHGHSITSTIDVQRNRIGIDTGAYRTGRLTALAIEDAQTWYLATEPTI